MSDPIYTQQTQFNRDLRFYLGFLLAWILFSILIAFTLEPSAERAGLQAPVRIALPIAAAFFIAMLVSFATGKLTASPVIKGIRASVKDQGSLNDNRSSIFSDFGFSLFFGILIGLSIVLNYLCERLFLLPGRSAIEKTLDCYLFANVGEAIAAGLGAGFILWIYLGVSRIERETNSKIMVQRYTTRNGSFGVIALSAVVACIVVYTFYRIFTLGKQ